MLKQSKNIKPTTPMPQALALYLFGLIALNLPAYAQSGSSPGISFGNSLYGAGGTTTLLSPLVPGASFSLPGVPATQGAAPPIGSGFVSFPVTPGMYLLPPTVIPWTNGTAGNSYSQPTNSSVAPANQIDLPSNQISLPVSNYSAMPPGALNAQVRGSIPHGPSTPGADPGMLRPPSFNNGSAGASPTQNYASAGVPTSVDQNGQLPDLLTGQGPNARNARQDTADYGLKDRTTFGYRNIGQNWVPQAGSTVSDFGIGASQLSAKQGIANQQATNLSNAIGAFAGWAPSAAEMAAVTPKYYGGKLPPQRSFDSPLSATYPGIGTAGVTPQNAPGNHTKNFLTAQVTNDLNGIPMINPNKFVTTTSGSVVLGSTQPSLLQPQTTLATQ